MQRSPALPCLALACAAFLVGCGGEPSFDARYEAQSAKIDATAKDIQQKLGEQFDASVAAGRFRTHPDARPSPAAQTVEP